MIPQTILLTLTLGSPSTTPTDVAPPDFAERLNSVDVTMSDGDAHLVALDSDGAVIGTLSIWIDELGTTWIAGDYDDGYLLISVDPITADVTREGDLDESVAAERLEALIVFLGDQKPTLPKGEKEKPKQSWAKCFIAAGGAAWGCYRLNPWKCVGGSAAAACACLPKTVKEFEGYKCPGV
jgi:hypothetical protein